MAITKEIIDVMLEAGMDVKNRRIYFGALLEAYDETGSDFSWRSVEGAIRAIHLMEMDAPHKPIEIHMSSPGGQAYEMLRLIDVIEFSPCQIKFFGGGTIMSAATWVMAVCDERYLYRNTRIMLHDGPAGAATEVPGREIDMRIEAAENTDLQNTLNKMYADNSRMPEEFYKAIVKRDTYLSADEAVSLGLADKVLEPKKRGNLRRMRIALLNKEVNKSEMSEVVNRLYRRIAESRLPSKIEIHSPKERFDSKIFVEKEEQKETAEQEAQPQESLDTHNPS